MQGAGLAGGRRVPRARRAPRQPRPARPRRPRTGRTASGRPTATSASSSCRHGPLVHRLALPRRGAHGARAPNSPVPVTWLAALQARGFALTRGQQFKPCLSAPAHPQTLPTPKPAAAQQRGRGHVGRPAVQAQHHGRGPGRTGRQPAGARPREPARARRASRRVAHSSALAPRAGPRCAALWPQSGGA
jgi:hypothetical protein